MDDRRISCGVGKYECEFFSGPTLCLSLEKIPCGPSGYPSRFPRNNRVVTKPPFPDVSHPLGAPLYLQSFTVAGKAVADANGFLRCGHGGGGRDGGAGQNAAGEPP